MKKRTKQVQGIINTVNKYLRVNHIKDTANTTFCVMTYALLQQDLYHGYNHYTADGRLANEENTDYIQIW